MAVAVAAVILLPWMLLGGDVRTGHAVEYEIGPSGFYAIPTIEWEPVDCWWDVFCLGFCDC